MDISMKTSKRFSMKSYAIRVLTAAVVVTILNIIVFLIGKAAGAFPAHFQWSMPLHRS
jgi:hypothetical protein